MACSALWLIGVAMGMDLTATPLGVPLPGLPNAPTADRDGVVWIPTDAGLVRLDGDDARVFTAEDGLPAAASHVVTQDGSGNLWVGTETGLAWMDGERAVPVEGVPGPVFHVGIGPGGVALVTVQRVEYAAELFVRDGVPVAEPLRLPPGASGRESLVTADGRLLMGTSDHGLMRVTEGTAAPLDGTAGTKAGPFADHPSGALFFGTGAGVCRSDAGGVVRWLEDRYVTGTALLGDVLYVGTSVGELWRVDDALGAGRPTLIGQGPPISLYELQIAGGGLVFGATWGGGLVRHDPADGSFDVFPAGQGVSSSIVRGLSVDGEGTLWIATEGGMDVLASFATDRFGKEELGSDEVLALLPTSSGALAVGTPAGLTVRTADGWVRRAHGDGLASISVEGIAEVAPDRLLLTGSAHGEGVSWAHLDEGVRVRPVEDEWAQPDPRWGYAVVDLPDGWLVERHRGGVLQEIAPDGTVRREVELPAGAVLHDGVTVGRTTWLGTSRGLYRWDGGLADPGVSVRDPDVAGVHAVGPAVWVSYGQPRGADRFGPDGSVTRFDRSAGLPDDRVLWVAEDGDRAWVGTRTGIARVDGDAVTRVLGRADGFPRRTHVGSVTGGRVWAGGSDGLRVFVPHREGPDRGPLHLVVQASLGGRPVGGPVPWADRSLVARVDARTHVDRAGLRFRWRLGPDASWSPWTTDRWIRTDLAAGAHVLEVEVAGGDGRSGRTAIPLRVDGPWWTHPATWVVAGLALMGLGAAVGLRRARIAEATRRRLETEVADRTAELRELAARLEDASAAKSRYLADMSHELRTPLNAIIGYTELLAEEARDSGADDLLPDMERVEVAARHLLALIHDVLDLSKIEAGRVELDLGDVELVALVRGVATTLGPLVSGGGNELLLELPQQALAHADAHRVRQILVNLLGNAAKFTRDGQIVLRVLPRDDGWCVEVADTGAGMSEEVLSRLFKPFGQGSAQTAATHGGTGLGLVISRELARAMGGDVTVRSSPGRGSVFALVVPGARSR